MVPLLLQEMLWQFLKELNIELPHIPAIPLLCIYPKEFETRLRHLFTNILAVLSTTAKRWQPPCRPLKDVYTKCDTYINWSLKESSSDTCYHMN